MTGSGTRVLTLISIGVLAGFGALNLEVTHSITHFLPTGGTVERAELPRLLAESPLARSMILCIGGGGAGGSARAEVAAELAQSLAAHPEVAWTRTHLDPEDLGSLHRLYFERRIYLVSDRPGQEIPGMFEPQELRQRARRLLERLHGSMSPLLSREAPADPLGFLFTIMDRVTRAQPGLTLTGGQLATADGEYAIVLLGLRSSPMDASLQAPFLAALSDRFSQIDQRHGGGHTLEQSGLNRLAVAAEQSMRRDMNLISALAITGVGALFLLVFRSPRFLLIAFLAPIAGIAAASAISSTLFHPLHAVTLAFGLALIGVAIDYPIHLMSHHVMSGSERAPRATAARVRGSLLLGSVTTSVGFATFSMSSFPGVGEMGIFAAIGVVVAVLVTLICLPAFLVSSGGVRLPSRNVIFARGLSRILPLVLSRPWIASAIPVACLVVSAVGLPRLSWEDDPSRWVAPDAILLDEDERVRQRVSGMDPGKFVLALARDRETALAINDRIFSALEQAVAEGHLGGFQSLHDFLWSEDLQQQNLAALRSIPDLDDRVDAAFSEAGFRPEVFRGFSEEIRRPLHPPLRFEDLTRSPLRELANSLLIPLGKEWGVITRLTGVRSPEQISEALQGIDSATYIDQQSLLREIYGGYRRSTLRLLAVGSALMFLVLLARYRSPGLALVSLLPSILVALTTLGLFGLMGFTVNLLGVISVILVIGMGVDYGVFMVDSARDRTRLGPTALGLVVSCLTTIFVFGTLALSGHPALRSIGVTTGTGICLALLISPSVLVLASRIRGAPEPAEERG